MDKIYTEAECVVVWLGEAQATDELALKLLKMMNTYLEVENLDLSTAQPRFNWDAQVVPTVPQVYFNALTAFLLRPWFSRVWMYVPHELFEARVWFQVQIDVSAVSKSFCSHAKCQFGVAQLRRMKISQSSKPSHG